MNIESIREYCLIKPNVEEGFPFGDSTLVFKNSNKIFLLAALDTQPLRFNLKCNPERAIQLREEYPETILPGFHMSKIHWNTIVLDGTLNTALIKEMIDDSYNLVSIIKKKRA